MKSEGGDGRRGAPAPLQKDEMVPGMQRLEEGVVNEMWMVGVGEGGRR